MRPTTVPVVKVKVTRCRYVGLLLGVLLLAGVTGGHAERFQKRGVSVPDAARMYSFGVTRVDSSATGAVLSLPLDGRESRDLLKRVLSSLRVAFEDEAGIHIVTEWVLWTYDPDSDTGSSKPPRKGFERTYERHRFQFSVSSDSANRGAIIQVEDFARQKEVDITPDSEYSWMQWQDFPTQRNAALTFLRRLQGDFESAMSSRLLPSTVAAPRIVEPVQRAAGPDGMPAVGSSASDAQPATRASRAVEKPVHDVARAAQQRPPAYSDTPAPVVPPVAVSPKLPAIPVPAPVVTRPAEEVPVVVAGEPEPPSAAAQWVAPAPPRTAVAPAIEVKAPPPVAQADESGPASAPALAVQGGLLVDTGRQATWQALLRALEELGVAPETRDEAQHMLTTSWIDARYDKKNQQFSVQSKEEVKWAFNLAGKGRQRHRFQLILIPVEGGVRTMVYAYHTGFQEETDRTPDSEQTLLYWKDRKTEPAVAMAFLRRLRVVVK